MFIYKITNKETQKVYIGQTIRPIEERFKRHIGDALNGTLDTHFARAIRKYGKDSFVIEQIDTAGTQDELNLKEQHYIRLFDSVKNGYNETDAIYKCGGNTYKFKCDAELKNISEKIRESKIGSKNPNSHAIKVRNEETKEEIMFDTVSDCQKYFGEKHHRFISTRVNGQTDSLYLGKWNIAYQDSDYRVLTEKIIRRGSLIEVLNLESGEHKGYTSIRKMCEDTGINRGRIKSGKNIIIDEFQITFK